MVRVATVRLLICVCAICGVDNIIGVQSNSYTRKRILENLAKFLTDKNQDARKFGKRLCRMLRKHKFFDEYFFKDMDVGNKLYLKKIVYGFDNNNNK